MTPYQAIAVCGLANQFDASESNPNDPNSKNTGIQSKAHPTKIIKLIP